MRRALVVYESMYGNTRQIAHAVAEGLEGSLRVEVVEVREAPRSVANDVALLVVGAPTHAFGLPRTSTRADAAKHGQGPGVGADYGVREWLDELGRPLPGTRAAAFSTAAATPRWIWRIGTAGRAVQGRLLRGGFRLNVPREEFLVSGMAGPLQPGELERARHWGADLASEFTLGPVLAGT